MIGDLHIELTPVLHNDAVVHYVLVSQRIVLTPRLVAALSVNYVVAPNHCLRVASDVGVPDHLDVLPDALLGSHPLVHDLRDFAVLICKGFTNRDIAHRLSISPNTVKRRLSLLMERCDVTFFQLYCETALTRALELIVVRKAGFIASNLQ